MSCYILVLLHASTKLFDLLRDMALSQQLVRLDGSARPSGVKMVYSFLGHSVCRVAFATLMGVSWAPRLNTIFKAVLEGRRAPPVDQRYMLRKDAAPKPVTSEVYTYLQSLYESVAETLPLDRKSDKTASKEVWSGDEDAYAIPATGCASDELRYLPPGTVYDLWRQYNATIGQNCSWHTFHRCWKNDFSKKLTFRDKYLFSVCPVCVQHKLLIRHLSTDLNARVRQRALFDRHLASQLRDRQCYWSMRASSRRQNKTIVCILDGMDQGKYATPRSKVFESHHFDKYSRPRLHVWGLLCHGYVAALSISDADVVKGGSTTAGLCVWLLTTLKRHGVDLSDSTFVLQLDNTGSSNKNNCVLSLASYLTQIGLVNSFVLSFLRTGHTHEAWC